MEGWEDGGRDGRGGSSHAVLSSPERGQDCPKRSGVRNGSPANPGGEWQRTLSAATPDGGGQFGRHQTYGVPSGPMHGAFGTTNAWATTTHPPTHRCVGVGERGRQPDLAIGVLVSEGHEHL